VVLRAVSLSRLALLWIPVARGSVRGFKRVTQTGQMQSTAARKGDCRVSIQMQSRALRGVLRGGAQGSATVQLGVSISATKKAIRRSPFCTEAVSGSDGPAAAQGSKSYQA
jgi:hypothetical protein